jgi:tRNA (mo5U34)-methyltransferase
MPWSGPLTGLRCLDVGTMDGFWAFEMERRGAVEVVAVDLADPGRQDGPVRARRSGASAPLGGCAGATWWCSTP